MTQIKKFPNFVTHEKIPDIRYATYVSSLRGSLKYIVQYRTTDRQQIEYTVSLIFDHGSINNMNFKKNS